MVRAAREQRRGGSTLSGLAAAQAVLAFLYRRPTAAEDERVRTYRAMSAAFGVNEDGGGEDGGGDGPVQGMRRP